MRNCHSDQAKRVEESAPYAGEPDSSTPLRYAQNDMHL